MEATVTKRMLSEKEGQVYTGLGRTKFRQFADEIGATTHIGARRVLFDVRIIDAALDALRDKDNS